MIGEGSVGDAFASMFTTFINNKLDKLVTPKDLLTHDNEQYILGELKVVLEMMTITEQTLLQL